MNYRHAFHAGGFADVVKHVTLVRILVRLRAKSAPFRVIDSHAGAGVYDLSGAEASRGGEWRDGIHRLLGAPIAMRARPLLQPYLDAIRALNSADRLAIYPGSPALARAFLRAQDRLTACELEPKAAAALARYLHGDRRCRAVAIDGWTALNAYLPPRERRGLVVVDPPFEDGGDFARLARALEGGCRKWVNGIYLAWYPIKEHAEPARLARYLSGSAFSKILRAELSVSAPRDDNRLNACGLIVVNPPWTLAGELAVVLPELVRVLSSEGEGCHHVEMLADEKQFRHFSAAED